MTNGAAIAINRTDAFMATVLSCLIETQKLLQCQNEQCIQVNREIFGRGATKQITPNIADLKNHYNSDEAKVERDTFITDFRR